MFLDGIDDKLLGLVFVYLTFNFGTKIQILDKYCTSNKEDTMSRLSVS